MNEVAIGIDLILYSRMFSVATSRLTVLARVDDPVALPSPQYVDLVLVDWGGRAAFLGTRAGGLAWAGL